MTNADRLLQLNKWYDDVPEEWQNHIITWPLVGAGFINIQLSIATGFPFGLLVLLTIAGFAAIRLPEQLGWIKPGPDGARFEVGRIDVLYDLNRLYDSIPELPRFAVFPLILIAAGTLSMWLTYHYNWPFGIVLLLAVLGILAFRLPYTWKLITPPPVRRASPVQMLEGWFTDAGAWFDGLSPENRTFTAAVAIGVVVIFDILVTSGNHEALALLVALELLAVLVIKTVRDLRTYSIKGTATPMDQYRALETLWKRGPDGAFTITLWSGRRPARPVAAAPAQQGLTMLPPDHGLAAADD